MNVHRVYLLTIKITVSRDNFFLFLYFILFFFILDSVIYYYTDPWQQGNYLLN